MSGPYIGYFGMMIRNEKGGKENSLNSNCYERKHVFARKTRLSYRNGNSTVSLSILSRPQRHTGTSICSFHSQRCTMSGRFGCARIVTSAACVMPATSWQFRRPVLSRDSADSQSCEQLQLLIIWGRNELIVTHLLVITFASKTREHSIEGKACVSLLFRGRCLIKFRHFGLEIFQVHVESNQPSLASVLLQLQVIVEWITLQPLKKLEMRKVGRKRRKTRERINRGEFKQWFLREKAHFHEEGVTLVQQQ